METLSIGAFEAKTHFSELIEKARQGMVFVVTRRGKPVAQLGPTEIHGDKPTFGSASEQVHMSADFDGGLADMAEYES